METRSPSTYLITLLIKSITSTYIHLKIDYTLKMHNETPSLRMWYTKLVYYNQIIKINYMATTNVLKLHLINKKNKKFIMQ